MGITTASGAQTHQRTAVGLDPLLIGTGPLHRTQILPGCFPKCEAPFPGQGTNKEWLSKNTDTGLMGFSSLSGIAAETNAAANSRGNRGCNSVRRAQVNKKKRGEGNMSLW